MPSYIPTIGLEVHAELKTRTKMFCDCINDSDEKQPNTNVCPVCMGHPGALPTINKQAVEYVIKVGLAIGGAINKETKFDRKNYFYPDLPKGYQISQYDKPLVLGGELHGVKVHRIHLEEDAGKLLHMADGVEHMVHDENDNDHMPYAISHKQKSTLVDFNRAGVPLMELVTEPDIHNAEDAVAFMKELQLILRYIGVSDADLERGQMRADANVSLSAEAGKLGTRAEVKNLNSFAAVASAIKYEVERQTEILDKGEKVHQETRGWDEAKQKTVSQRSKAHAHDYRYFPEPDLPPIDTVSAFNIEDLQRHLPELPRARQARFVREFGLTNVQAGALVENKSLAEYYEAAWSELAARDEKATAKIDKHPAELLYNYLTSDLAGLMNESGTSFTDLKVDPNELAALVDLIADGTIMSRQAKDILGKMFATGESAETILNQEGLHTVSDDAELAKVIEEVIAENPQAVADYRKGKEASMQFLIGKSMGKLRGRGNPETLREIFKAHLQE